MEFEIHSVFTEDGYWLGDFPNAAFAETFRQVIRTLDDELNQPEPKPEEPVRDQLDPERQGV